LSALLPQAGRLPKPIRTNPLRAAHTQHPKSPARSPRRAPIAETASGATPGTLWKNSGGPCWPRLCLESVIELLSVRVVRWLKAACAMSGEPGPMSPPRAAKTQPLANRLAADLFSCDVFVNLHPHLEHKGDLVRVVEIRDL